MNPSELIVDFPKPMESSTSSAKHRQRVRFSAVSTVAFFCEKSPSDDSKKWYRPKDYKAMKEENKRAIRDIHRMARSSDDFLKLDRCLLAGIENFCTPKMIVKSCQSRKQCLEAVVEEQARQHDLGINDPKELARVSNHHSKWAAKRAYAIGRLRASGEA